MKKVHLRITLMMTLLVVVLMILSALVIALPGMQGREYGMNPAVPLSSNIQPNPTMNTNITWSTFHNGWSTLEYNNGTANTTIDASTSTLYANPISVNPTDIQAIGTLQAEPLYTGGKDWNASAVESGTTAGGSIVSGGAAHANGEPTAYLEENTSASASNVLNTVTQISMLESNLPSANLQYDYITVIVGVSATKAVTGAYGIFYLANNTGSTSFPIISNGSVSSRSAGGNTATRLAAGQEEFISFPLSELSYSAANFNISVSNNLNLRIGLSLPQTTTSSTYNITLYGLTITENPLSLGSATYGQTQYQTEAATGNGIPLSTFAPNFKFTEINNHGYTVAVSQPIQNLTTQQSAINSGSYIEQVEYQGQFNLPTAPDLSYGPANLTEHFNVSTSQTQVLDINGVSYLSTISGKNNTVQLISSVNPNSQTQFLQIVDYTQSQWTSISSPPGIFTLAGIEYYWEEFIIAILAVVGVGAGAASRHAANLRRGK